MRASCRKFLDTLQAHRISPQAQEGRLGLGGLGGGQMLVFFSGLGELGGIFEVNLAMLSVSYGLLAEEELASIFPESGLCVVKVH